MNSEISICNKALGWLGQDQITSFEDPGKPAELCKLNYPTLRDAVLEARTWRFATERITSKTTLKPGDQSNPGFPQWGDGWVHPVPPSLLAVYRCYSDVSGIEPVDAIWQRENDYLIAECSTLYIWGVGREQSPTNFSQLFVEALATRIAADLAIPLTENRSLQADLWSLYNDKIDEGAARDGQQGRAENTKANRLRGARAR